MSILVYQDEKACGKVLATLVAATTIESPDTTIGLMFDSILSPAFRNLKEMMEEGLLSFENTRFYQLCEFVPNGASVSLKDLLFEEFLQSANLKPEQYVVPYAENKNWAEICSDFEADILEHGGLDLAILALKPDGSLIYNLPGGDLAPITHVEKIGDNKVVSAGMATIMRAKKLLVVATGTECAEAVQKTLKNVVSDQNPASFLQLHRNATFLLDEQAASML